MDQPVGPQARKHARALLVAGEREERQRWIDAARDDLSLDVRFAASLDDALRLLRERPVDVAVVAATAGGRSYREVLRALLFEDEALPVVVVGALDGDAIRDALALGASDVVAPSDLGRLGPAIARALRDAVVGALLRRTRAEAAVLEEALRRLGDDVAVVAVDGDRAVVVHAARRDAVGRGPGDLPFVRDAEEAEELTAAVLAMRPATLVVAGGVLRLEPFSLPPYDRRFVALTVDRGLLGAPEERDPVTGLPQRSAFERRAREALAQCERDGSTLGVLFLDVDRFRAVNELGDHAAGDDVLRAIGDRLRAALPHGCVARFGGDEFVMLSVDEPSGAVHAAVDAAVDVFTRPFMVGGKPFYLTASVGVALAPEDASDVAALIGYAEAAVFEAKRLGRNLVRWYASPNVSTSAQRLLVRRDLQGALARGEFELYYQPMYDVETRAVQGVEALLRWRHPHHGLVLPDHFIPVAEECGLIEGIGAWVLDRALAQVRAWSDAGIPAVRVSVNVSARQLENAALPALVGALLRKHGVAASCLEVEITESSIMRDVGAAAALLRRLRELGVRVLIDDFGTGYTSLGILKRFAVDGIKIDRSFVADVASGGYDDAVVRAVTTFARAVGVRTVAEGVEVPEQLERLRALDCDAVQGFLFSAPLPALACTPLLAARVPA